MSNKKVKLGHELVEAGLISPQQLDIAIKEQQEHKKEERELLGEILLRLGFIKESVFMEFLEKHLRIPYVELKSGANVDRSVVKLIPERMARHLKSIAIGIDSTTNKIIVAMTDPLDIIALDTIRIKTGYEVDRRFSFAADIMSAIGKFYEEAAIKDSISDYIDIKETERKEEEVQASVRTAAPEKEDEAGRTPVIDFVNRLLSNAIRSRASDIHVEPRQNTLSIRYRIDGFLHETFPPPKEMQSAIVTRLKLLSDMNIAEQRLPQDGRFKFNFEGREIDVRAATTPITHGEKMVLRLLDKKGLIVRMNELGMSPAEVEKFKSILKQAYGMVLVTGPTGSGKTTTLYSALNFINTSEKNIVTIEDPVEYQLEGINQIQVRHNIGLTFASGLRAVLRQDPNVIMIGEIRDLETLENAIKASLTGHLVLSTLHTNDAPSVVVRLMHMGLETYLIASCLSLVIAQRLVRIICPGCKEKVDINPSLLADLKKVSNEDLSGISFFRGRGCDKCDNTGYKGRTGLFEFMAVTGKIKNAIKEGVTSAQIKKVAQSEGVKDIFHSGIEKVNKGITTIEEVLRVTVLEKAE